MPRTESAGRMRCIISHPVRLEMVRIQWYLCCCCSPRMTLISIHRRHRQQSSSSRSLPIRLEFVFQRPVCDDFAAAGALVGAGLDRAEAEPLLLLSRLERGELLREDVLDALMNLSRKAPSQPWSDLVVVAVVEDISKVVFRRANVYG